MRPELRFSLPFIAATALVALAWAAASWRTPGRAAAPALEAATTPHRDPSAALQLDPSQALRPVSSDRPAATPPREDGARAAAQRGLDFLARATPEWQRQHECFGCHVQAVTMEALAVGQRHGYAIDRAALKEVLAGLTTLPGGARSAHGLSHSGGAESADAKSFGGSALAAYDRLVADDARDDLVSTARALLQHQADDGSVTPEVARFPVSPSAVHSTYRAAAAFRQAFARTADDVWQIPLRRAELFLRSAGSELLRLARNGRWQQDVCFAILGLVEAGASSAEPLVLELRQALLAAQAADGAWSFDGSSPAFATGQALYTLRRLGLTEAEPGVARAIAWLVEHQDADGSWSAAGAGKAEAMWAVLGLATVDVAEIEVAGLVDGARLEGPAQLAVSARSTSGGPIAATSVTLDVTRGLTTRGGRLGFAIDPAALSPGLHLVEITAVDAAGQKAIRRLSFYTGDHFLAEVGSRFAEGETRVAFRSLADGGTLVFEVRQGGALVHRELRPNRFGPHELGFAPRSRSSDGRFVATLAYLDAAGVERHSVRHEFVHLAIEEQKARFGEVQGKLRKGQADLANQTIELVDERGRVVQRTVSTASGQYRFKNLDSGRYRVRVGGDVGRAENEVSIGRGVEAASDLSL